MANPAEVLNKKELKKFYPEVHDAGKLLFTPINYTDRHWRILDEMQKEWQQAITQHHYFQEDDIIYFPSHISVFLITVADHFSASFSRVRLERERGGTKNYHTNKLWNKRAYDFENYVPKENQSEGEILEKIVREKLQLSYDEHKERLIEYLKTEPVNFLADYQEILEARPEDVHPLKNITSLYEHLLLTKKMFWLIVDLLRDEILSEKKSPLDTPFSSESIIKEIDELIRNRFNFFPNQLNKLRQEFYELENKLSNSLRAYFCEVLFFFPHYIFKAHDLYILKKIEEKINSLLYKFEDNLFLRDENRIVLILGDNKIKELEDELKKISDELNLFVEIRKSNGLRNLKNEILTKSREELLEKSLSYLPSNLPDSIRIPCEVCRIREGKEYEEDEKKVVLCEYCFRIRKEGKEKNPFKVYSKWENEDMAVVHFKLDLFGKSFQRFIEEMYNDYVKIVENKGLIRSSSSETTSGKITNFLPFINSFRCDFIKFRKSFIEKLLRNGREVEEILENTILVRLNTISDVINLGATLHETLYDYFSSLYDVTLNYSGLNSNLIKKPLRVFVSVNKAKYPFFLHWRDIEEFVNENFDFLLCLPHKRPLKLSFAQLKTLIEFVKDLEKKDISLSRAKIHQIRQIANVSQALAELVIRKDKEVQLPKMDKLIETIEIKSLFDFLDLMDDYLTKKI